MKETISNFCWEFCYEFIPANPDDNGDPQLLILNLPYKFGKTVSSKLLDYNFYCSRMVSHGNGAVIMQFKKVGFPVEG